MNEFEVAHDVLANFPERLREHRWKLNLSFTDVEVATGVNHRTVAAVERNQHRPTMRCLLLLLDWMGRSYDDPPRPGETRAHATERAARARLARTEKEAARGQVQAS